MKLNLVCEICREVIGTFDPEALGIPLMGEMFGPKDDIHGYDSPFFAGAEWEFIRHLQCGKRPFLHRGKVMTDKGYFEIGSYKIPGRAFNPNVKAYTDQELEEAWNQRVTAEEPVEEEPAEAFRCEECGNEYSALRNLRRHIKKKHSKGD